MDPLFRIRSNFQNTIDRFYTKPLADMPGKSGVVPYLLSHIFLPKTGFVLTYPSDDQFIVRNMLSGESYYFPRLPGVYEINKVGTGYQNRMWEKYTEPNFVAVESGDVVFDCGAFVGAFSLSVSDQATTVHAIEPALENRRALVKNIEYTDKVEVHPYAVSDQSGEGELNLSHDDTDHSLIDVDDSPTDHTETVEITTIAHLAEELNIDTIDFLKIDAEGIEPEVLRGALDKEIQKIAVDCGAERFGNSTYDEVDLLLTDHDFTVRRNGSMVYAKKN